APPPAMARRDKIIESTGSPPELHHEQIRASMERVTQVVRDERRRMLWSVSNTARTTRISIEEMAGDIKHATAAAIANINAAVDNTMYQIELAADDEMDHITDHQVLTGETLRTRRDEISVEIFNNLQTGSEKIQQATEVAE